MKSKISIGLFGYIFFISFQIFAQGVDTVWVDDDFNDSTLGWGSTHFSVIQEALDSVNNGGVVNVASGSWIENIQVQDGKKIIGAGIGQSIINGNAENYTVVIRDSGSIISNMTLNNYGDNWDFELSVETGRDIVIENIHIIENGMILSQSNNCTVSNIRIDGTQDKADFFISTSWNNVIENSVFHNVEVWLWDYSCNNILRNNEVVAGGCTVIRSRQSHNNLYENNIIRNGRVNLLLMVSNNNIITGNTISGKWDNPTVNSGGIVVFRGSGNTIVNNTIDDVRDGGITLFCESLNNLVQANKITNAERGIELYYSSNNNRIINNNVTYNNIGIILDNTLGNIIYENNLDNYEFNGFDNGDNEWDFEGRGNYWCDYKGTDLDANGIGDTPQSLDLCLNDRYPFMQIIPVTLAAAPNLQFITFEEPTANIFEISDFQTISTTKTDMHDGYRVKNGGTLILENVNWTIADDFLEPFIIVEDGGSLTINNSKIVAQGGQIEANRGSSLLIENSELVGLGTWDGGGGITVSCDNAVIRNNIIRKCYVGICPNSEASNYQIVDNEISESFNAINNEELADNNLIEGNTFYNIISGAVWGGGYNNSSIINNTFRNVWFDTILLVAVGPGRNSENNIINNNNFFNCGPFVQQGNENFDYDNSGNYYSDYLDRYPNAEEHSSFAGIWDQPYIHTNKLLADDIAFNDNYPLMNPVYSDKLISAPEKPLLIGPAENSVDTSIVIEFSWGESNNASSYRLQISADSNFAEPVFNKGSLAGTNKSVNILEKNKVYYWRVLADNQGVISPWSTIWNFSTGALISAEEMIENKLPEVFDLKQNYPNPFNPNTKIEYSVPENCFVELKIFDFLGQEIINLVEEEKNAGKYTIDIDMKNYSSGIYFYRIIAKNFIKTRKMLLIK